MTQTLNNPGKPSAGSWSGMRADPSPYVDIANDYEPWMDQALCTKVGHPDDWFPKKTGPALGPVKVCNACPVRMLCLERALKLEKDKPLGEIWGIVGGLTAEQRRRLRSKKRKPETEPRPVAKCGTTGGYERHRRLKSAICQACRDAAAVKAREQRAKRRPA